MKVYFNTKAFEAVLPSDGVSVTEDLAEAELAVLGGKTADFGRCRKLKAVYRFGVGSENLPLDLLRGMGVEVHFPSERTREALYRSAAEFTVFLIFHMHHAPVLGDAATWQKSTRSMLSSKKLLILGAGNIGGRVRDRMSAFMEVSAYDVKGNRPEELLPRLASADIVTLHVPMAAENKHFIDRDKLSRMKDDAVLINTARGALVDEEALHAALSSTRMRAAFDVFWKEPYAGKLKDLGPEKFFMTPHVASQTREYVAGGLDDIMGLVARYAKAGT